LHPIINYFFPQEALHAWHISKKVQNQGRIRPQKIKGSSNARSEKI
jgi:hypothetical protein